MTSELVPWRGHTVPVLGEVERSSLNDFFAWVASAAGSGLTSYQPVVTSWGSRQTEPVANNFPGYVDGLLYADGPVAAAEAYRLRVFGQAPLLYQEIVDGRPGNYFDDPALDQLRTPWSGGILSDLAKRSLLYSDFAGNAYIADIDDELVLLRPDWVEIVLEQRMVRGVPVGFRQVGIAYYEGGLGVGEAAVFTPGEYAHFISGIPDPLANYRGMSWLTPIVREVQADKEATQHKLKYFENAATPNMVVKTPAQMTREQFKDFVAKMRVQHEGTHNAYKTLYLGDGADATVLGGNMQQMDFTGVQGKGETRIANAAGVPPVLLSFSEGMQGSSLNAGNYQAAKRSFVDTTMRDLWMNWCGSLQAIASLKPKPKTRLWYDARDIPFLHEDAKDIADIQATQGATINGYVREGWEPETAVAAVHENDVTKLKHTGNVSVQLQPPGAQDKDGNGQPDDEDAAEDDYQKSLESLRSETPVDNIERKKYDVRNQRGTVGGGRFRKLSDAIVALLDDWDANGRQGDPLADYETPQLKKAAEQLGVELPAGRQTKGGLKKLLVEHKFGKGSGGDLDAPKKAAPAKPGSGDELDDFVTGALGDLARENGIDVPNQPRESDRAQILQKLRAAGITRLPDDRPAKEATPAERAAAEAKLMGYLEQYAKGGGITQTSTMTGAAGDRNRAIDELRRRGFVRREGGVLVVTPAGHAEVAKKAAPAKAPAKKVEAAGTVRAEGYSTAGGSVRVVADGKGGYVGQRQVNGKWQDDPAMGTGGTPKDITSRFPRNQWSAPARTQSDLAPAKKAAPAKAGGLDAARRDLADRIADETQDPVLSRDIWKSAGDPAALRRLAGGYEANAREYQTQSESAESPARRDELAARAEERKRQAATLRATADESDRLGPPAKKAAPKAKPERSSTVAELEAELGSLSTPAQKRARLRKYGYSPAEIDQMAPLKPKGPPKTKAAKQQFLADLIDAELAKPGLDERAVSGAASPRELLEKMSQRLRAGEDDFETGFQDVADHMAVRFGTGVNPEAKQVTDAFARIRAAYRAQVPEPVRTRKSLPARPDRPPAKPAQPRLKVDLSPTAKSTMDRLQSFDDPPSRAEAHELLKGMNRADLQAMGKDLSVPNASKMSMAKLRNEIVEATAGRRLDSISIRGFRGRAPGDDGPKG